MGKNTNKNITKNTRTEADILRDIREAQRKTQFLGKEVQLEKPTKAHRMAIWECMMGTVYAMNEDGEVKYFDYKYEEAFEFAGIKEDDLRLYPYRGRLFDDSPYRGQAVLWTR